jgi:hypothetical protein
MFEEIMRTTVKYYLIFENREMKLFLIVTMSVPQSVIDVEQQCYCPSKFLEMLIPKKDRYNKD